MMRDTQMEFIQKFKQALQKIKTYPIITEIIAHYIKKWMRSEELNIATKLNKEAPTHTLL